MGSHRSVPRFSRHTSSTISSYQPLPPLITRPGRVASQFFDPDRDFLLTPISRHAPTKPLCCAMTTHISTVAATCWAAQYRVRAIWFEVVCHLCPEAGTLPLSLLSRRKRVIKRQGTVRQSDRTVRQVTVLKSEEVQKSCWSIKSKSLKSIFVVAFPRKLLPPLEKGFF